MAERLNLPELPKSSMFIGEEKTMTIEWQEFFRVLFKRLGGIAGPVSTDVLLSTVSELYNTPVNYTKRIDELERKLQILTEPLNYTKIINELKLQAVVDLHGIPLDHNINSHSDTDATGAELDTLTDDSIADALHRHSELVASDGSPDPAVSVDATGNVGIGTASPDTILHVYKAGATAVVRLERNQAAISSSDILARIEVETQDVTDPGICAKIEALAYDVDCNTGWRISTGNPTALNEAIQIDPDGNVGIGTPWPDSPSAKLQVVGDCRFGEDTTNYANFATDGEITLLGTARVTKDIWVSADGFNAPGTKPAAIVDYGIASAWEFTDGTDDTLFAGVKLPDDMDKSVGMTISIGWSTPTAGAGNCRWQVEYLFRQANEAMDAAADATLVNNFAASAIAKGLVISTIGTTAVPNAADVCLTMRIKRRADEAADTLGEDNHLHGLCIEYTSNKLGTAT